MSKMASEQNPSIAEMNDAYNALGGFKVDDLHEYFAVSLDELRYAGFDPKFLLAVLIRRGKANNPDDMVEVVGSEVSMKDTSYILCELNTLAFLACMRGSKIKTKIMPKTGPEGKEWIDSCIKRYIIKETANPGQSDATLLRILAIFSHSVVLGVARGEFEPAITPALIENSSNKDIPKAVLCSVFGSMIPQTSDALPYEDQQLMVSAWMYHQYKFDRLINNPAKHSTKEKLLQFGKIQMDQQFHPNVRRLEILRKSGLLTAGNALNDNCRPGLQHLKTLWDNVKW
uniref:Nucleoprotein n=1 Tax=Hodotermopsis sjostedti phenuivirus 3 TaxID=3133461 RepID=A0AAT9JH01_9VIRU